jgi:hypothetical protein
VSEKFAEKLWDAIQGQEMYEGQAKEYTRRVDTMHILITKMVEAPERAELIKGDNGFIEDAEKGAEVILDIPDKSVVSTDARERAKSLGNQRQTQSAKEYAKSRAEAMRQYHETFKRRRGAEQIAPGADGNRRLALRGKNAL